MKYFINIISICEIISLKYLNKNLTCFRLSSADGLITPRVESEDSSSWSTKNAVSTDSTQVSCGIKICGARNR